ncbi:MAG: DUF2118 domain-containing protein [Thermogladius sp.]
MPRKMKVKTVYGLTIDLVIDKAEKDKVFVVLPDGKQVEMRVIKHGPDRVILDYDGVYFSILLAGEHAYINTQPLLVSSISEIYETPVKRKVSEEAKPVEPGGRVIKAPISGRIVEVKVKKGDRVKQGDVVAVMESMKMVIEVKSHLEGEVLEVHVQRGQAVGKDAPLVTLK